MWKARAAFSLASSSAALKVSVAWRPNWAFAQPISGLHVAQFGEVAGLRLERGGHLVAQGEDLGHHRAGLRLGLRLVVVEQLTDVEGAGGLLLGVLERRAEGVGGLETELGLGEA